MRIKSLWIDSLCPNLMAQKTDQQAIPPRESLDYNSRASKPGSWSSEISDPNLAHCTCDFGEVAETAKVQVPQL